MLRLRWVIYLVILLAVALWKYCPRPWKPARTLETTHFVIAFTATQAQTG